MFHSGSYLDANKCGSVRTAKLRRQQGVLKAALMARRIPTADDIYVVICDRTRRGGTYFVGEIARVPLTLKTQEGLFVRYKGGFYPLHDKHELGARMEEIRGNGFFLSARSGSVRRRNETDSPRAFILDSERIQPYYDPVARKCSPSMIGDLEG